MSRTPQDSANRQTLLALAKLGQLLRAHDQRDGVAAGLSPTQIHILRHVARNGATAVSQLANALSVSQPTTSDAIAALLRKALVSRISDGRDRRTSLVALTAAGRTAIAALTEMPTEMAHALDGLNAAERGTLQAALVKVIRSLQEQHAIPVQRLCLTCAHFQPNVHPDPDRPHHCRFVDAAFGDAELRADCGDHEVSETGTDAA